MIVKMTLHDNDLVYYIEEFCEHLPFKWFTAEPIKDLKVTEGNVDESWERFQAYLDESKRLEERKKDLFGEVREYKKNSPEYQEIVDEIKRQWKIYLKTLKEPYSVSLEDLEVSIQYSLKEHDNNHESLYWFSRCSGCVIM